MTTQQAIAVMTFEIGDRVRLKERPDMGEAVITSIDNFGRFGGRAGLKFSKPWGGRRYPLVQLERV